MRYQTLLGLLAITAYAVPLLQPRDNAVSLDGPPKNYDKNDKKPKSSEYPKNYSPSKSDRPASSKDLDKAYKNLGKAYEDALKEHKKSDGKSGGDLTKTYSEYAKQVGELVDDALKDAGDAHKDAKDGLKEWRDAVNDAAKKASKQGGKVPPPPSVPSSWGAPQPGKQWGSSYNNGGNYNQNNGGNWSPNGNGGSKGQNGYGYGGNKGQNNNAQPWSQAQPPSTLGPQNWGNGQQQGPPPNYQYQPNAPYDQGWPSGQPQGGNYGPPSNQGGRSY